MTFIKVVCFPLLIIYSLSIQAQTIASGSIKGQLIEKASNKPVGFANVILYSIVDSVLKQGTITDNEGNFNIANIDNGSYYIQLNSMGFEPIIISEIIIDNKTSNLDLGTTKIALSSIILNAVSVVSQKKIQNNSIDRKVYNVEEDISSQTGSVSDILQNIPSVNVDIDGTVSLRGTTDVTFLMNGKPSSLLNKNSAMVLQQIPAANIERIEIITNPSAKYKPDGIGGMINIVLKKEKQKGFNGMVLANAGNDNRYNNSLSLNYNTGKLNIYGGYGLRQNNKPRSSTDYRISRDSSMNVINSYNSSSSASSRPFSYMGNIGMEYQINDHNIVEISGNGNIQDMDRTQNTNVKWADANHLTTSAYAIARQNKEAEMEWESTVSFMHQFKKEDHVLHFELNVSGYDETEDNHYTETYSVPSGLEDITRVLIKKSGPKAEFYTEYTLPIDEDTELEAGYEFEVFRDNLLYLGETLDITSNRWSKDIEKTNDFIFDQQIHAMYCTFSHSFDQFSFMAGVRAEQVLINSNLLTLDSVVPNNYFKVYPTLHLSYQLDDNQELQLNYSKRVKRPDSDEMNPFPEYSDPRSMESGNPYVKPEQTHSIELGYQLKKENFSFIPSIYYRYKYDAFTEIKKYVNDSVLLTTFENLSSSQAAGTEFILSANIKDIARINLSLNGYYSKLNTTNTAAANKKEIYAWDSKLNANITVTESTLLQLNTFYRSKRIKVQGTEDPSYRVNLGIRQDLWKKRAAVILTISDLFNTLTKVSYIDTPELYRKSVNTRNAQIIYVGFSYRFGQNVKTQELKFDDSL